MNPKPGDFWVEDLPAFTTEDRNAKTLDAVLDILNAESADHALFGGLVAPLYGASRPAADVDILVPWETMGAVGRALAVQGLRLRRFQHLIKVYQHAGNDAVADLLAWQTNRVLAAAFAGRRPAVVLGRSVKVVSCGAFVALKFEAAATVARRPSARVRDVNDVAAVLAKGFPAEEEARAFELAGAMYPGASANLATFLAELRRGRYPEVARRMARRSRLLLSRAIVKGAAR